MPDQVAFVVMPFNRKQTGHTEMGVPTEVDFDALWENVYQPVLEKDLGSKAVRADRDVGALIISQMVPLPLRSLLDSGALHQLVNAL